MKKNIICLLIMLVILKTFCIAQPQSQEPIDSDDEWLVADTENQEDQSNNILTAVSCLNVEAVERLLEESVGEPIDINRSLFILFRSNRPYTDEDVEKVKSIFILLLNHGAVVCSQLLNSKGEPLYGGDTILHILAGSYDITYMELIAAHSKIYIHWNILNEYDQTPWDAAADNPEVQEWLGARGGHSGGLQIEILPDGCDYDESLSNDTTSQYLGNQNLEFRVDFGFVDVLENGHSDFFDNR